MAETTTTTGVLLLAALLMAATVASAQAPSPGGGSCAADLAACQNAVMKGETPTKQCCSALSIAIKTQLPCLCRLFAAFSNSELALSIPKKCDLQADANICSASQAPPPQAAAPSPGSPKGGKNAASKLTGTGLAGLILISITMMF